MKKTGSEMPSDSVDSAESAEVIHRARLQADVAQQRVRLAKEELRRARKRLKEAKREAKRARKYASLARKDWKRARRQADKEGSTETASPMATTARTLRKRESEPNKPPRSRRTSSRRATKPKQSVSKRKMTR
jgi:hypothetical protein